MKQHFIERAGGLIIDAMGRDVTRVCVEDLTTSESRRVIEVILEALNTTAEAARPAVRA